MSLYAVNVNLVAFTSNLASILSLGSTTSRRTNRVGVGWFEPDTNFESIGSNVGFSFVQHKRRDKGKAECKCTENTG